MTNLDSFQPISVMKVAPYASCVPCPGGSAAVASYDSPENLSTSRTPSHEQLITLDNNHRQDSITLPDVNPLATAYLSTFDTPGLPGVKSHQVSTFNEAINLNHMGLLIHLTFDREIFSLADGVGEYSTFMTLALRIGLKLPCVLHQFLAFSARHLAFHPDCPASYLYQAITSRTVQSRSSSPHGPRSTSLTVSP